MSGWYKQQRNLSERPWFQDSLMVHLYHYLKERAYVTDGRYEGRMIRRGSCPVTRSEMMETTGMSYRTLDRVLKKLQSFGEIIVRGNNRFSVISVCDYDGCEQSESLFGTTDDTTTGITDGTTEYTADGTAGGTTHLSTIEGRRKKEEDNLVSPYGSYKKDKEALSYEIKDRWNRMFSGKLKPVQRLTMPIKMAVMACLERFGMQSIDLVFEQVLMEHERTGFVASFQFVFELVNYQGYLKRAKIRVSKRQQASDPESGNRTFSDPKPQQGSVGVITESEPQRRQQTEEERRAELLDLIEYVNSNPGSASRVVLEEAFRSGELERLGINWQPTNN